MKRSKQHLIYLFIILTFSLWGMKALFHPGLFTAHDIWHQVVRLYYYSQAISDGQMLPLWIGQLANGFGYPLFFFSYHLPWVIGLPFLKAGLQIPETIKLLFFISFFGSGLTMYFFMNSLLKSKPAAFLTSVLYMWLPYHFLIIFVSASIGVAFIFTFLPVVLLGIHLLKEKGSVGIPLLALGLSGLLLSHIMHLIFLFPLICIFMVWEFLLSRDKIILFKNIAKGTTLALLISSFYLLPAYFYSSSTRVAQETGFSSLYQNNFINLSQLIYSKWGYSPIVNNAKAGEISFQLGIAQWISMTALIFLLIAKKLKKEHLNLSLSLLLAFIFYVFLMLDYSKLVWENLVKFVNIDYPFRLLLPLSFIASLAAGILFVNQSKKFATFFLIIIIFVAIFTNRNHLNVNQYTNIDISDYLETETEKTTNTFNEYLPRGVDGKLLNVPWNEVTGENLSASNTKQKTNSLLFNIDVKDETTASAGQFNFPGQTVYVDGTKVNFNTDKAGRIAFNAPSGKHKVEVKYEDTALIKVSKYLSLVGIAIFFWIIFKEWPLRKKRAF